ncbi:THO complex subunit 5 homolog [Thrips palmi]|uniref:THO complex subunit 5 homolog n=1 Tax=Thrips palmi TaxID=161013 RepID=A0A6P8ZM14_THRPL|nr:THO complex subunit 5 homolog [Thrips palmi]
MKENGTDNSEPLLKKRRKASQLNTTPPTPTKVVVEDVYKSVCEWEENEAAARDPDKDRKLFSETCNSFRNYMEEIAALKKKGTPEAKAAINVKCSEACLLFVMLRKLNRLNKLRLKHSREELQKVKGQVDSQHLQLQNLLYEVLHLQKEVNKCLQFKSQDENIDLVPIEEFMRDAPEALKASAPSKKSSKEHDAHQLQKARLEWELTQRRELAEMCKQMHSQKETVAKDIEKQQQHLDNLAPMLRNILQATKPVEESLGEKVLETRMQHQLAYLLPACLFFLYVQADAQQQASDPLLVVTIDGDEDEARRLKDKSDEGNQEEESDSDQEQEVESNEKSKRHHRKRNSKVDRQEERRKRLLAKHPLTVNLTINLKDGSNMKLVFSYLLNLGVVTVKCSIQMSQPITGLFASQLMTPENILCSLYPGDTGKESPNVANDYQLQNVGLGPFSDFISDLGAPYIWAQRVSGLDFISQNPESSKKARIEVSKASVPSVIKSLRQRFKSRLALCKQVQSLETGIVPPMPSLHDQFPTKINSQISDLKQISWDEYRSHKSTQWLINQQQVIELDSVYRMSISHGPAKALALIAIKSNYPESPPMFSMEVNWKGHHSAVDCDAIRDMECEVNVYYKELMAGPNWVETLLAAQVTRLLYCFDIYLEASSVSDEDKKIYPREKVYFQASRGRARALPYKYLGYGGGVFTQR